MDPLAALLRYPLFAALDPDRLCAAVAGSRAMRVLAGESLIREGEAAADLYVVEDGRVRVVRSVDGREVSLGRCRPGEVAGDHALLPPGRSRVTLRAAADSVVRRVPLVAVHEAVSDHPAIAPRLRAWVRLHYAVRFFRGEVALGVMSGPSFLPLTDRCQPLAVPCGTAVQTDGLNADCYFLVRSGGVLWTPDGSEPGRVLGPGDGFGASALAGAGVGGTAVATEECSVARVTPAAFLDRPEGDPDGQTVSAYRGGLSEYPWVGQERAEECGLAALAMAARHHGRPVGLADLRPLVALDGRGTSVAALATLAERLGLRANAIRVCPAFLPSVALPAVAHLRDGHFVTLFHCDPLGMTVGDPARGVVTVPAAKFQEAWTGAVILLRPSASPLPDEAVPTCRNSSEMPAAISS